MDATTTTNTTVRARIVITSTARPKRCSRCHTEISTHIVATTPFNRRMRLMLVPTAVTIDNEGLPLCADCAAEDRRWMLVAADVARRTYAGVDRREEPAAAAAEPAEAPG